MLQAIHKVCTRQLELTLKAICVQSSGLEKAWLTAAILNQGCCSSVLAPGRDLGDTCSRQSVCWATGWGCYKLIPYESSEGAVAAASGKHSCRQDRALLPLLVPT